MILRIVSFAISLMLLAAPVLAQVPPGPGPSFYYTGTAVNLANSATSTTLLTVPIAAGYITAGVICRIHFTVSTGASPTGTALSLAGVYGTAASTSFLNTLLLQRSTASAPMMLTVYLQQTGSVITQKIVGLTTVPLPSATSANTRLVTAALTQGSSGVKNLLINAKWATASNLFQLQMNAANCSVGS